MSLIVTDVNYLDIFPTEFEDYGCGFQKTFKSKNILLSRSKLPYRIYGKGCYALFSKQGDLLYIGVTDNYNTRIKSHVRYQTNTSIFMDYVSYVGLIQPLKLGVSRNLEGRLIEEFKPIFNSVRNGDKYRLDNLINEIKANPRNRNDIIEREILNNRRIGGVSISNVLMFNE